MPFDWRNFLVLAEDLATRADEASKRSAISRAYYFVFHLAKARAVSNGVMFRSGEGVHSQCWRKYQSSPDPSCKRIGVNGDRMKARRGTADYDPGTKLRLDDDVQRMLEEARQFEADLATLNQRYPQP